MERKLNIDLYKGFLHLSLEKDSTTQDRGFFSSKQVPPLMITVIFLLCFQTGDNGEDIDPDDQIDLVLSR